MLQSNLALGPMSKEVIEAIFRYSDIMNVQLMLISSRNQVDVESGYVFRTKQYAEYIRKMKKKYPQANIVVCRDHCGPNFGNCQENDLDGTKKTIKCDLENGFDLIHLDLCLATWLSHEEKLDHTLDIMRYALSIKPDVMFEIGTDKNVGVAETDVRRIISDVAKCRTIIDPTFYVVQTGSLVVENRNSGTFASSDVGKMSNMLHKHGIRLKEHNADYLTTEQIGLRRGLVDAINVAPQLGVIQTLHILSKAIIYGINVQPFAHKVVSGYNWKKWSNSTENNMLYTMIAGHYHFSGHEYEDIIEQLSAKCDIRKSIVDEINRVISHYSTSLRGQ